MDDQLVQATALGTHAKPAKPLTDPRPQAQQAAEAAVAERWRERAIPVAMVPLLDDERRSVLDGRPAVPAVDHEEIRLLGLVAHALPIRTIARELGLGEQATQKRLAGLRRRFGAGSTAELSLDPARSPGAFATSCRKMNRKFAGIVTGRPEVPHHRRNKEGTHEIAEKDCRPHSNHSAEEEHMKIHTRTSNYTPLAVLLTCLIAASTVLTGPHAAAEDTIKWVCEEGVPQYFHDDGEAGTFSTEEPQSAAPFAQAAGNVRIDARDVGGVKTAAVDERHSATWRGAFEQGASFEGTLCGNLEMTLYVAAPTSDPTSNGGDRTSRLGINVADTGKVGAKKVALDLTPTPVEVNLSIPTNSNGGNTLTVKASSLSVEGYTNPVTIVYGHPDFPSHFVPSTWVRVQCAEVDPDPRC